MLDVAGCLGQLSTALHVQLLGQMVLQARWHTDSPLTTLPHLTPDHLPLLRGVHALPQLQQAVQGNYQRLEQVMGTTHGWNR